MSGSGINAEAVEKARRLLRAERWRESTGDRMGKVLGTMTLLIAGDPEQRDVQLYQEYYARVVELTDPGVRWRSLNALGGVMAAAPYDPVVYLPILSLETETRIAAAAAVEFVCCTGWSKGEHEGMRVLEEHLRAGRIRNPGAVFGGLVIMGEAALHADLLRWKECLTAEQVDEAAQVSSSPQHHPSLSFWLDWAEELIESPSSYQQRIFGSCALAMVAGLDEPTGRVEEIVRSFPSHGRESALRRTRFWTQEEYAGFLAPRLYRLEAEERPPKLFSAVLRRWGLEPKAKLKDQVVPVREERKESEE